MIKLCAFADEYGKSLLEQIEGLKINNISYVELRSIDGKNVLDFTDEEALNYYNILNNAGIKVWSIGSPIGKVDISINFDEYKEKVKRICEIAGIMKTNKVRMFSFFNAYSEKDKVIKYLKEMVDIASVYHIDFCHENEKEIYGDTIDRVLYIIESIPGLKFVYDPANFIQCNQDSEESIEKLFDKMEYFHIKDVIKETQELVPAGLGDGQIKKLISKVKKDVVFTIEPHLAVFEGYSILDKTTMKNKYTFKDSKEAFNAAVKAIKSLLIESGYKEIGSSFIKE